MVGIGDTDDLPLEALAPRDALLAEAAAVPSSGPSEPFEIPVATLTVAPTRGANLVLVVRHDRVTAAIVEGRGRKAVVVYVGRERVAEIPSAPPEVGSTTASEAEPPDIQRVGEALASAVRALPRRFAKATIVVGGRLVRQSLEYLPKARAEIQRIALRRVVNAKSGDVVASLPLGGVKEGAVEKAGRLAFVADAADMLRLLTTLESLGIRCRYVFPEDALSVLLARSLGDGAGAGAGADTALWIEVTPERMTLDYVRDGKPLFFRRSTTVADARFAQRASSDVQRTNVFFHRRFLKHEVRRISFLVDADVDPRGLTVAFEGLSGVDAVVRGLPLEIEPGVESSSLCGDRATVLAAALAESWRSVLNADLAPREWNADREALMVLPGAALVAAVALGFSGFVAQASNRGVVERAVLRETLRERRIEAAERVARWEAIRESVAATEARLSPLAARRAATPALGRLLMWTAENLPPDVAIVDIDCRGPAIDADAAAPDTQPFDAAAPWRAALVLRTPFDYFDAGEVIDAVRSALEELPGLVAGSLRVAVAPFSLPYVDRLAHGEGADENRGPECRFTVSFEVTGS